MMTERARYISVTEAAERLGVHRKTALHWVHIGRLVGHKTPGGHWRVEVTSLLDATLSPQEFADAVGVDYRTVLRWLKAGRLASAGRARHGGYRIPAAEVERVGVRSS